jgi:signal transduction histidine kinase
MSGGPANATTLAELAHDMRSSLAAATAYLDLARERVAQEEPLADADLANIERSLSRLALSLSKLEGLAKATPRGGEPR